MQLQFSARNAFPASYLLNFWLLYACRQQHTAQVQLALERTKMQQTSMADICGLQTQLSRHLDQNQKVLGYLRELKEWQNEYYWVIHKLLRSAEGSAAGVAADARYKFARLPGGPLFVWERSI